MFMIPTILPYGAVNINNVKGVILFYNKFYLIDNYGKWQISEETYEYLLERGVSDYGRASATTKPI